MTSRTDAESPVPATVAPTRPSKLTYGVAVAVLVALGIFLYLT